VPPGLRACLRAVRIAQVILFGALLAALAAPAGADAQAFGRCPRDLVTLAELPLFGPTNPAVRTMRCSRVTVPLDRTGTVAGDVHLLVTRIAARRGPAQGAVVGLSGGPGEAAAVDVGSFADAMAPALATRDLIVPDQRGTGHSGALHCRALDKPRSLLAAVGACADELGERRAFYRSIDSVDDLETIRQQAGYDKLTLYGTSYGTKVALMYAQRYPEHVERLALDSVVPTDGPDPYGLSTLEAVPRIFDQLCDAACRTRSDTDPTADLTALVARIASGPLDGEVVEPSGRRHAKPLLRSSILGSLIAGDFEPEVRTLFPGALHAAARGDTAPVARLTTFGTPGFDASDDPSTFFSDALNLATLCTDVRYPWDPLATAPDRAGQALTALAGMPDAAFGPFDRATGLAQTHLCLAWPGSPAPATPLGPPPDVPVLVLSGSTDLRTPTEDAQRVAALSPQASLVQVPGAGHSVLSGSACAQRAVRAFFADATPAPCPALRHPLRPAPTPPLSLAEVPRERGVPGRAGRTATAIGLTIDDAETASELALLTGRFDLSLGPGFEIRVPGLRSGDIRLAVAIPRDVGSVEELLAKGLTIRLHYDGVEYVPGVRIDGAFASVYTGSQLKRILDGRPARSVTRGTLRVAGGVATHGTLTATASGSLVGKLGGHRVRIRTSALAFDPVLESPADATALETALRIDPECCG
jgi:pimeloyl-ACP methyl ester carboxylesterase